MTLLQELMKEKKVTIDDMMKYTKLSEEVILQYVNGEAKIIDCPIKVFAALAQLFDLTVQDFWEMAEHYDFDPKDFEIFKSNTGHLLKRLGNRKFIKEIIDNEYIEDYWKCKNRLCACYLLAMIDYLCRLEKLPLYEKFDLMRGYRLPKLVYPYSFRFIRSDSLLQKSLAQAIPEFYRHGIIEGDVFNVC